MEVKQHAHSAQVPRRRSTPKHVPQTCPDLANTTASPRPFVRLFGLFVDVPLGTCESVACMAAPKRIVVKRVRFQCQTGQFHAKMPPRRRRLTTPAAKMPASASSHLPFRHGFITSLLLASLVAPLDHTPHHVHNIISTLVIYLQICRRTGCVIPCCKL